MSGGKGGSSTSEVTIPEYIERAAQRNLNKAEKISQIGYVPYYGPDVAAFTPMQQAGFQNTADVAGAFGMAAPTTQRDIMGGMKPPKSYADGVRGYSSQPMFQQSLDALRRERPGQAKYIDSFFVNPKTGKPGSNAPSVIDYTSFDTMAETARKRAANALAISQNRSSALSSGEYNRHVKTIQNAIGDPSYNPATDVLTPAQRKKVAASPSAQSSQDTIYMNLTAGNVGNSSSSFSNPSSYGSYGGSLVTGGPSKSSSDYFASATKNTKVDLPGNVVSRALNIGAGKKDSSSSSGYAGKSNDGTVMCTAYCEMGYLPKEIWALDRRYGVKMYREDPTLIEGYHMWGVPVANYLRKQTVGAKVARAIMWPVVKAWAEEMAHNMKPEKYAPNYIGKAIKFIGEPFSRMCGKLKSRKIEEMV